MKSNITRIVCFFLFFIFLANITWAGIRLIPFQGRLTDGSGSPLNGVYQVIFAVYDEPTGGEALWSEIHSSVSVIQGQVNVLLGSLTDLDDPDGNGNPSDAIKFTQAHYLGITVGADYNQEMVPRHRIVPSFHAQTADFAYEAEHAYEADHALEADHADLADKSLDSDKLGNQPPEYYASGASTDTKIADLLNRIAALEESSVPTGSVLAHAGEKTPSGFYECDGRVLDQGTDPGLFAAFGIRYGFEAGNPSSFKLPDYRGYFLRGWDHGAGSDPNASVRTDSGDGVTTGDNVGTKQNDELRSHSHKVHGPNGHGTTIDTDDSPDQYGDVVQFSWDTQATGGSETRPKNINVMYICKK